MEAAVELFAIFALATIGVRELLLLRKSAAVATPRDSWIQHWHVALAELPSVETVSVEPDSAPFETGHLENLTDLGATQISVVIPCLNEARTIGPCVARALAEFEELGAHGEVIVADNGSSDASVEIAERSGARVIRVARRGYGSAIRAGMEAARGSFIILGDADGSHDFAEIPRFIAKWREGYEFVIGNRFRGEIKAGAMEWHHRHFGTPVISMLVNLFFHSRVGDVNCGMRGMTKDLFHRLDFRTTGMEFASESLIKAAKSSARIAEVPVTAWPDQRGRPAHLRAFRDGWRHLRFIFLYAPNWLFLLPGLVLLALGLGLVAWLLPGPRFAGKVGLDIHTIAIGTLLALAGVHIISIGLFVKAFCFTEKLNGPQRGFERWLRRVKLEHGLLLGAALLAIGIAGDAGALWHWAAAGFGKLYAVRQVFVCTLSFFLGLEVLFSSIFLSMLGISRETFLGQ
jgi:hypothetical protein